MATARASIGSWTPLAAVAVIGVDPVPAPVRVYVAQRVGELAGGTLLEVDTGVPVPVAVEVLERLLEREDAAVGKHRRRTQRRRVGLKLGVGSGRCGGARRRRRDVGHPGAGEEPRRRSVCRGCR